MPPNEGTHRHGCRQDRRGRYRNSCAEKSPASRMTGAISPCACEAMASRLPSIETTSRLSRRFLSRGGAECSISLANVSWLRPMDRRSSLLQPYATFGEQTSNTAWTVSLTSCGFYVRDGCGVCHRRAPKLNDRGQANPGHGLSHVAPASGAAIVGRICVRNTEPTNPKVSATPSYNGLQVQERC